MHTGWSQWVLLMALLLQSGLLIVIWGRGVARRLPVFAVLIAFYVLRSALLFGIFDHISHAAYASLYESLSFADLLLQALVAAELAGALYRSEDRSGRVGWHRAGLLRLLAAIACAALFSLLFLAALPRFVPVPVDRPQVFLWCLLALLWAGAPQHESPRCADRVGLGLCLYSAAGLLIEAGRIHAALRRDAIAYTRWSYGQSAVYAATVMLWIVLLRRSEAARIPAETEGALPVAG